MSLPFSDDPHFAPIEGGSAQDIEAFLTSVLEGGPIDNLALFRITLAGEELVRRFPVGSISPVDLAQNIQRIIAGITQAQNRRTSFLLQACKGTELRGTTPIIREASSNGTSGPGTGIEPANEHGFLAQTMRHTEAAFRYGLTGGESALAHWKMIATEQAKRIRELESREIQVTDFARQVMIREVDTEYMRGKNKQNLELQKAAGEMLIKAIPHVIKKVTETKALDKATGVLAKVETLVKSLKTEQVVALAGILEPEQAEALKGLLAETNTTNGKEQSNGTSTQAPHPAP